MEVESPSKGLKRKASVVNTGPSHVLFSAFPPTVSSGSSSDSVSTTTTTQEEKSSKKQKIFLRIDPRLEKDYVSRRKRAYDGVEWSSKKPTTTPASSPVMSPWDGVSKLERELVECCESLEDKYFEEDESEEDGGNDEDEEAVLDSQVASPALGIPTAKMDRDIGGVLAIEKEITFAAILARGCHTMASRALALAILERSLKAYVEEETANARLKQQQREEREQKIQNSEQEKEAEDAVATEPSQQSLRYQNRMEKRRQLASKDDSESSISDTTIASGSSTSDSGMNEVSFQFPKRRRFDLFFAAGGLRILSQWLADASSYETTTVTRTSPAAKGRNKKSPKVPPGGVSPISTTVRKASSTRPVILSILHFLEHIPFEKKIVMNSKINKQIQKLGKRIDSIQDELLEQNQGGKGNTVNRIKKEDLEGWTTQPSVTNDEALSQVKGAVNAVKASWREKAKGSSSPGKKKRTNKPQATEELSSAQSQTDPASDNPLEVIQSKIRERLELITQFETGVSRQRPEWYRPEALAKKKSSSTAMARRKRKQARSSGSESDMERKRIEEKIKEFQSRSQKSMEELRERLRQRKAESAMSASGKSGVLAFHDTDNKTVTWKDGLRSQVTRNRNKLEEVFFYEEERAESTITTR